MPAFISFEILCFIFAGVCFFIASYTHNKQRKQLKFIEDYAFHSAIKEKLKKQHPLLPDAQLDLVFKALRDYFHICNKARGKMVSMPSQAVDDAWHEFILFSKYYEDFCQRALGRFLHHTPAEVMPTPTSAQDGIKRAWRLACAKEEINPKKPNKLPLLFAIDSQVNIDGGFIYKLDCMAQAANGNAYCASHIGGCGGGFGGGGVGCGGDSGCGSGCGGGCGGG
jgi:hypothetical protein